MTGPASASPWYAITVRRWVSAPVCPVGVLEALGVLAVCWWLWTAANTGQRLCAAIVLGGAASNLLDRLQHGAVTDWIRVAPYPPYFNLADLAIRGGLIAAAW